MSDVQTETKPEGVAEEPTETRRFRVFRFKRDGRPSWFDAFEVPVGPRTTLIDALRWIQLNEDPTLAIRHSCLHASCGTCGILANGREVLMCVTFVHDLGREITVEPISNIPVLTDLVVDMRAFYERYPQEHPLIRESEFLPDAQAPTDHDAYVRFEDCIECGLCVSACPIVATADRYSGPAALGWAQRVVEEPRGHEVDDVLDWADHPDGVWRCHAAFECTAACPSNVNPAARIMALRGLLAGGRLGLGARREETA